MANSLTFKVANDSKIANGTSLRGYITTTYNQLVEKLGEPRRTCGDGKVTAEWILEFEDQSVATIYDWKANETPMGIYKWNVGGKSSNAVKQAAMVLGVKQFNRFLIK